MKNRILITGGAGFIGSNLVKYLLLKKKLVNVLDNLSNGSRKNLPKNINFFRGDIRSLKDLEKSSKDCNAIIHLAAKSSFTSTEPHVDSKDSNDWSILGFLNPLWNVENGGCFYLNDQISQEPFQF